MKNDVKIIVLFYFLLWWHLIWMERKSIFSDFLGQILRFSIHTLWIPLHTLDQGNPWEKLMKVNEVKHTPKKKKRKENNTSNSSNNNNNNEHWKCVSRFRGNGAASVWQTSTSIVRAPHKQIKADVEWHIRAHTQTTMLERDKTTHCVIQLHKNWPCHFVCGNFFFAFLIIICNELIFMVLSPTIHVCFKTDETWKLFVFFLGDSSSYIKIWFIISYKTYKRSFITLTHTHSTIAYVSPRWRQRLTLQPKKKKWFFFPTQNSLWWLELNKI